MNRTVAVMDILAPGGKPSGAAQVPKGGAPDSIPFFRVLATVEESAVAKAGGDPGTGDAGQAPQAGLHPDPGTLADLVTGQTGDPEAKAGRDEDAGRTDRPVVEGPKPQVAQPPAGTALIGAPVEAGNPPPPAQSDQAERTAIPKEGPGEVAQSGRKTGQEVLGRQGAQGRPPPEVLGAGREETPGAEAQRSPGQAAALDDHHPPPQVAGSGRVPQPEHQPVAEKAEPAVKDGSTGPDAGRQSPAKPEVVETGRRAGSPTGPVAVGQHKRSPDASNGAQAQTVLDGEPAGREVPAAAASGRQKAPEGGTNPGSQVPVVQPGQASKEGAPGRAVEQAAARLQDGPGPETTPAGATANGETRLRLDVKSEVGAQSGPSKEPGTDIVQQVVRHATLFHRAGKTGLTVQLEPEHLGRINLRVLSSESGVVVRVLAETRQAGEVLEANIGQLKAAFQERGIQVDRVNVHVGQYGEQLDSPARGQAGWTHGGGQRNTEYEGTSAPLPAADEVPGNTGGQERRLVDLRV